jgi:hypothetical protein
MQNSSAFNFEYKTAGIVAHDAGAANHLIAWIVKGRFTDTKIKLSFHGPALNIAEKLLPNFVNYSVGELISSCSTLIVGTGWQTDIEFSAIKDAKLQSLNVISVLDHWTNYSQRFTRDREEVLPNQLWVVDEYAEAIANKEFPSIPVSIVPNDYLESQVEQVNSYRVEPSATKKVLFLMEPIRDQWGPLSIEGEIMAFNNFIDNLHLLPQCDYSEIIIRPHPSDPEGKYLSLLASNNQYLVSISNQAILAGQIAWADIVVGCQTYAMVVALYSGKKVLSSIPRGMPECTLPFDEIIKLSDLV